MAKGKNGCGVAISGALADHGAAEAELERLGNPKRSKGRRAPLSESERAERRAEVNAQVEELDRYIQEAVDNPQVVEDWLQEIAKSDLWRYSYGNLCLARSQARARDLNLTRIAGFRRWEELGYKVRKGEKGLRIIAPKSYTRKDPQTGEPLLDKQGNPLKGRYFGTVSVFDISQTEPMLDEQGNPLNVDLLSTPDSDQALMELKGVAEGQGIEVLLGGAPESHPDADRLNRSLLSNPGMDGFFVKLSGRPVIVTRPGLGGADQARVLAHELAHALMHSDRAGYKDHDDRARKEAEAESAAYVIASHYGLADQAQALYVARWISSLDDSLSKQLADQGLSAGRLDREVAERKRWAVRDALANIQGAVRMVLDGAYDQRGDS